MANKDMFNMIKSNFKRLYPNATTDQFINYLRTKHKEIYKFAERNGFLKQLPAKTTGTDITTKDTNKKPPISTQQQQPKGNGGGQKQITGSSPKLLTSSGNQTTPNPNLEELYKDRKTTISKEDVLGKGAKATEGAAKATSKEGLLGKLNQIKNAVKATPKAVGGAVARYALPVIGASETVRNWNAKGSTPQTRALDIAGDLGAFGGAMISPFLGNIGGQILSARDKGMAASQREWNAMQQNDSVKALMPEQQAAAGRHQQTGIGGQLPTSEEDALKINLYGTTNVTGDSVPVDNEGILDTYTGSTGGAVGGDGAGTPPSQGLTEIGDSGNGGSNNNGGVAGGVPVGGSAAQAATYQPSGILPASPEYYADEAYLANLPFVPSEYTQQSLDNLSNGYVKQADIYEKLNRAQQAYNDAVAAQTDPRYQGGLIQATGYNVNPVLLQDAQSVDRVAQLYNTMYGENNQIGAVKNVLDNAQANYEVGIANQAGVPYADYKQAMLDRREQEILARAQDIKNQLEFQKNQTADLKERRELAQKQYEVDAQTHRELMKARLENRRDIEKQGMGYAQAVDTAMISGQYGNQRADIEGQYGNQRANIAGQYGLRGEQIQAQSNRDIALINNEAKRLIEATKQGDSTAYINAISNLGTMLSGMSPQMVEAFLYGNPAIREAMFGKGVTPEQAMIMLGRYQNSDNKGTGFWNWLRGNK